MEDICSSSSNVAVPAYWYYYRMFWCFIVANNEIGVILTVLPSFALLLYYSNYFMNVRRHLMSPPTKGTLLWVIETTLCDFFDHQPEASDYTIAMHVCNATLTNSPIYTMLPQVKIRCIRRLQLLFTLCVLTSIIIMCILAGRNVWLK